ncbi:MAG: hypothetical protein A2008_01705 [Candidatus Wallbacteria bacterium GWC2_49_35]|uniref:Purine nucleoside phosphorylase n=1 Tax=Candidatus Wallbacteria bacterium GWC2_49_35 TaxID=1817813 RepID=A0A1F7WUL4_9BACT|nr:MAG: hypothetical protein A2008_01705 [Candidatus Wallbacteria bacterium GWC2_49_35]HBC76509.1 peptidoglycan editing factor PgeF [Candidatus Wallbacteria bacterium]
MSRLNIVENEKYFKYEVESPAAEDAPNMLFTTRRGGVSDGRYSSLNMGYSTADAKENIYKNRALVLDEFKLNIDRMVSSDQVHGTILRSVSSAKEDAGQCDGIFTCARQVVLSMYFADCTPLYFYDAAKSAIGLSHAGWRGTAGDIASMSIKFMESEYGSRAEDITAVIGPSIGPCCFEVGAEVTAEFEDKLRNINVKEYITAAEGGGGKHHIDLKSVNRELLLKSGLKKENIHTHLICTSCAGDVFYSYRRDRCDTGRMAALAFLN